MILQLDHNVDMLLGHRTERQASERPGELGASERQLRRERATAAERGSEGAQRASRAPEASAARETLEEGVAQIGSYLDAQGFADVLGTLQVMLYVW